MPTKILVADDSATMRRVLEMTFAGEDATVTAVETADAALAKAAELSPDLIFADASLPGVDGYELAKRIKGDPKLAKIAVVVMASQQAPYDDAKGRGAGVDDHISKPFDTQSVIDRVGQVLAKTRATPAGADAKPAAAPAAAPPAARPAPPAPVASAANSPVAAPRVPQGTRMGVGAVPLQPAAKAAPAPIPAPRPAPAPLAAPAAATAKPFAPPPARPAAAPAVAAVASAAVSHDLSGKLAALGLTREQVEGVLALSREVVEQVVWEVVPELAEAIIKEEIKRLTSD
ncbi:MAG TPA: response regulator [Polyangiales bacterium]|nr:response regulator [Polyangiales bacterium]